MYTTIRFPVRILSQLGQAQRQIRLVQPELIIITERGFSKPSDSQFQQPHKGSEDGTSRQPSRSSIVRAIKINDSAGFAIVNKKTTPIKAVITKQNVILKQEFGPLIKEKRIWEKMQRKSSLKPQSVNELNEQDIQATRVLETGHKVISDVRVPDMKLPTSKIVKKASRTVLLKSKIGKNSKE